MTSKLTRERLQEIAEDGFLKHGESKELARIALAAMDSEPVVFTDERNLHHIAMGRETSLIWGKQNSEAGDVPLYRHAQQPVVPQDVLEALQKVARIRLDLNDFDGARRGIADCLGDAEEALIEVVNRRAAMLQGAENAESCCGIQTAPALDSFKKNAESRCGNSPVIPEGYVMVPKEPTAEMQSAGAGAIRFDTTAVNKLWTGNAVFRAMLAAAPQETSVNDVTTGKPLTITLPDISSKAFWSGAGQNETFHPETYRRWVKEAVERACIIASIDVEVK